MPVNYGTLKNQVISVCRICHKEVYLYDVPLNIELYPVNCGDITPEKSLLDGARGFPYHPKCQTEFVKNIEEEIDKKKREFIRKIEEERDI